MALLARLARFFVIDEASHMHGINKITQVLVNMIFMGICFVRNDSEWFLHRKQKRLAILKRKDVVILL